MKIVFLNTWNGKVREGITKFIQEQSRDTDIFCFQEIYDEMKILCKDILANFEVIFAYKFVAESGDFPQATYVKKDANLISSEIVFEKVPNCGLGIYTQIRFNDQLLHICNFHGLSKPGNKIDNPDRLKQSQGLIDFFKDRKGLKIIGGDMNLLPGTKSVRIFGESGYRDLIKDFRIQTTRNRFAWELYPDNKQYHSNYVFVSPDLKVKNFSVPNIEISDHLPMILEI